MDEAGEMASRLIQSMDKHDITVSVGVAGMAIAMGRLLSDLPLDDDAEHKFAQWVINMVGMYFAEGEA